MHESPPILPKSEDESHLDSLAVAHYVVGGIAMLFACLPIFHMIFGLSIILGWMPLEELEQTNQPDMPFPPELFGWIFFLAGAIAFSIGQAVGISLIYSGRCIKARRKYMFSFVLACIACVFFPFGTALGVFTLIVLNRQSVKTIYGR